MIIVNLHGECSFECLLLFINSRQMKDILVGRIQFFQITSIFLQCINNLSFSIQKCIAYGSHRHWIFLIVQYFIFVFHFVQQSLYCLLIFLVYQQKDKWEIIYSDVLIILWYFQCFSHFFIPFSFQEPHYPIFPITISSISPELANFAKHRQKIILKNQTKDYSYPYIN